MSRTAILVASRNRPDLVDRFAEWTARNVRPPHDLFVVECGSEPAQCSRHATLAYDDAEFRGKCFGHNLLLRQALERSRYDYYWVLMNDLVFADGEDPLAKLIAALEREPRMALVSPTAADGGYPESAPQSSLRSDDAWRPVTTVDYLGFVLRDAALREVGFLNPNFRYCWGAIHELSFQLHRRGWFLAYSDAVTYRHLGGSTYGVANTKTISREEYQRRARRFAFQYFLKAYGPDWERVFWDAARPFGARFDTYAHHRRYWSTAFSSAELAELEGGAALATELDAVGAATATPRARPLGFVTNPCALGPLHDRLLSSVSVRELADSAKSAIARTPTREPAPRRADAPRVRMSACFTREELAPFPDTWTVGPPDFVGVGCGKSGGSWWYDLLLKHPQIVPNRLDAKELHYFCHQRWDGPDAAAIELYSKAFARPAGKLCGEWSGNFLNHPLSVQYLAQAAPQAKLIAILRNPIDRCASNLNQFLTVRAKLLGLEGERQRLLEDYSLFPEAVWSCLIANALRQLFRRYPRQRVLVLQYEAIRDDPLPAFARTCEFLGIDATFRPDDARRPVNRNRYVFERPDARARARLAEYFEEDVRALASLLPELDLSLWNEFASPRAARPEPASERSTALDVERLFASGRPRRLLLGCGQRPDPQRINVDLDRGAKADLFLDATDLAAIPDASVEEIRSYHLFEHFTRAQARSALREWRRVLRPGGALVVECPNLAVCARELGRHRDDEGEDLALTGLFGPPQRAEDPAQRHNWGWTPESLRAELVAAGFTDCAIHPVDQSWRAGARFGRDMQVRAARPRSS